MIEPSEVDESESPSAWTIEHGLQRRDEARLRFAQAQRLADEGSDEAEQEARGVLRIARSALHWLEETEFEDEVHAELHEYGSFVRNHFPAGCTLHFDKDQNRYSRTCPADLVHLRMGMSVGFVGNRLCSICGHDASDCEHMPGDYYEVVGGPNAAGTCPVCLRRDCEDHAADTSYRVRASVQITDAEIFEISVVSRPKQPDARFEMVSVTRAELEERLGPQFKWGMRVNCDKCLLPCGGFVTLPGPGTHPDTSGLV